MRINVKYKEGTMKIKIAPTEVEKLLYHYVRNFTGRIYRGVEGVLERKLSKQEDQNDNSCW